MNHRTSCRMSWKTVREKGDPEDFTDETKEWIQVILGFLTRLFELEQTPVVIYDREYWNRTGLKGTLVKHNDFAASDKQSLSIFINPKKHNTDTKRQLCNTILHEFFHLRFPKLTEKQIKNITHYFIPIFGES